MTVLLVLATFAAFLVIDYFYSRNKVVQPALELRPQAATSAPRLVPSIVGGFRVPEHLRFHPGHAWALSESPNLVRVGMDDFATKVTGKIEKITLPQRGQWVRQGQKIWSLERGGKTIDMVSPIEGTVSHVNDAAAADPSLVGKDPYGEGWLVTVQAPDTKTNFRNLLQGTLARWWTEEAAMRLHKRIPGMVPAMAQDGGLATMDLTATLPQDEWASVAKEFFLS